MSHEIVAAMTALLTIVVTRLLDRYLPAQRAKRLPESRHRGEPE